MLDPMSAPPDCDDSSAARRRLALLSSIILAIGTAGGVAPPPAGAADEGGSVLGPYARYLVGAPALETRPPRGSEVAITYLGVNGYLVRSAGTTLAIDPYFSRVPAAKIVLNARIAPCARSLAYGMEQGAFPRRVDGFLSTHCHIDHLFDIPTLQKRLGGKIVTSRTGMHLCEAAGTARRDILLSLPGSVHRIGGATVHVLPAKHDKVLGDVPYQGRIVRPMRRKPNRPADWVLGTPLSFLIELHGKRIYLEAGAGYGFVPDVADLDLAILGVALKDSRKRFPDAARKMRARYLLPTHQDSLFTDIEDGFHFSPLADFSQVADAYEDEDEDLPGEMILMDYFHTWTIPD